MVNKVVTADMDADAIGGSVNLVTKSAPAKRIITATAGTGWNLFPTGCKRTLGAAQRQRKSEHPVRLGMGCGNLKLGAKVVTKEKKRKLDFYDYEPEDEEAFNASAFAALKDQTRSDFYAGNYQAGSFISKQYLEHLDLNNGSLFTTESGRTGSHIQG